MRDWRKEFNALPPEVRKIACALSCIEQIRYLEREEERLKKRYRQSLKEINNHIRAHQKWFLSNFGETVDREQSS